MKDSDKSESTRLLLFYRRANSSDWKEVVVSSKSRTHKLSNLECGSSYEVFMTASNSHGKSDPSTPLMVKTLGKSPPFPRKEQVFKKISSTEVLLNLSPWKTSDCSLSDFVMRLRHQNEWTVLTSRHNSSSNVFSESLFPIRSLSPQTSYQLEVTAINSAGVTKSLYDFYTKSLGKRFLLHIFCIFSGFLHLRNHRNSRENVFSHDLLVVTAFVEVIVAIVYYYCAQNNWTWGSHW